ncbi:MAG: ABC transporter substrate-binding protein [Acidimicrobiia bacterium]|nr:MAG: ABC transporter substrate-binding protein [Acidimicrobiia bacterium]
MALVVGACGGGDDEGTGGGPTEEEDAGEPQYGGEVTYALEADTTGGWCLAEAQLAISGIQVARAIYDTLTAPDENGEIKPFLAESVTSNDDATQWTIKLRSGVKFHDGTDLTAEVVKNNLDAYRNAYPGRSPLLFSFVFEPYIADIQATDPTTVVVTTKQPWPAFPWFLYSSGRLGIMGQAQLDDAENCNRNLIGTGPFKLAKWTVNEEFVAERNENYWQTDENGNQLPYLDRIRFVPVESGPARLQGMRGGSYDMMHTSGALQIVELRKDVEAGTLDAIESDAFAEVGYTMLNATKAPFDSRTARQAVAYAIDRDLVNELRNEGILTSASGPFAEGVDGYLEDTGYPSYDKEKAEELVAQYRDETGQELEFTLTHSGDPETTKTAELLKQLAEDVGMRVNLASVADQSTLINEAIARNFQAVLWRNHPGADPDTQYVWWHCNTTPPEPCDNLVNFGGFNDPEINDLLDRGRTTLDPDERREIYEELNREFAEELYNLWGQWTLWMVAYKPGIHGVLGPNLPDGSGPFPGLATGHPVSGIWIEQ